ncbi:hypothetical protein V1478_017579 [Vespula squamosa]|uniref:Uncharacterized protein n=1 Tax=Vespula squamosa TaxID=30214 RepID=A0ABD1ZXD0_VESSQ
MRHPIYSLERARKKEGWTSSFDGDVTVNAAIFDTRKEKEKGEQQEKEEKKKEFEKRLEPSQVSSGLVLNTQRDKQQKSFDTWNFSSPWYLHNGLVEDHCNSKGINESYKTY